MHHKTLKAAVEKYSPLHLEGKSEEEVKAEIEKDEKAFDDVAIAEIYAAIIGPVEDTKGSYFVDKEFRDVNDFSKVHEIGADVSHFEQDRLDRLVSLGHVTKEE